MAVFQELGKTLLPFRIPACARQADDHDVHVKEAVSKNGDKPVTQYRLPGDPIPDFSPDEAQVRRRRQRKTAENLLIFVLMTFALVVSLISIFRQYAKLGDDVVDRFDLFLTLMKILSICLFWGGSANNLLAAVRFEKKRRAEKSETDPGS